MAPKRLETSHQSAGPFQPGCVGMFCGQCSPLSVDGGVLGPTTTAFWDKVPDRRGGLLKLWKRGRGKRRHPGGEGMSPAEKKIPKNKAASHRVTPSVSAPNFKHHLSTSLSMGVVHADGFWDEEGLPGATRAPAAQPERGGAPSHGPPRRT